MIIEKDKIENEFFPKNGFGDARLSVAKKAITEFKKNCSDTLEMESDLTIDFM